MQKREACWIRKPDRKKTMERLEMPKNSDLESSATALPSTTDLYRFELVSPTKSTLRRSRFSADKKVWCWRWQGSIRQDESLITDVINRWQTEASCEAKIELFLLFFDPPCGSTEEGGREEAAPKCKT